MIRKYIKYLKNRRIMEPPLPESPNVVTFGCRLNLYESEIIRSLVAGRDDVIVVNSCAVTAEAERGVRQSIRRLRREHPDKEIVVTGCASQISPETYKNMPEVDRVVGNAEKTLPASYAPEGGHVVSDIMEVKELSAHMAEAFDGRTRALLQVQNGCNHRCTFCVIPYGRGNSRSVPAGEIVAQVRKLVESGYKEIVLTGVDMTGYGGDLPGKPTLGMLARRILKLVPELPRLRLSSIDVAEADKDIMDLSANEERFMPYFHLSLQAGDDMILKRMKRRHTRDDALRFCETVRRLRPGTAFGADMIAGFPTENEEMFLNSERLVSEAGLQYLHVFPYSAREGTPAARMPQVPRQVKKERAARLREAGRIELLRYLDGKVGKTVSVLAESGGAGRTDDFVPVRLPSGMEAGEMAALACISHDGAALACERIGTA
jgi:threonylcarbamoyladenosine tRNA methylthiotransferase MtaB